MAYRAAHSLSFLLLMACGTATTNTITGLEGGTGDAGHDSGLPSGQCRTLDDCQSVGLGYYCGAGVLPPMCKGQCESTGGPQCKMDAECTDAGVGMVCSGLNAADPRAPCFCGHGGPLVFEHCAPGCSSKADCGPGLTCDPTHRCVAASCSAPADCGSGNFDCVAQKCAPKACKTDGDCADFCVMGSCSQVIGKCALAVP